MLCCPMRKLLGVMLIALSGCGGDSGIPDNHGFGFAYDSVGTQGLHLRKTGATVEDANALEARARTVGICANITAPPPPYVIMVPQGSIGNGLVGFYESSPPLILLETDAVFEHEVLHYLLDLSTGNPDPEHKSPLWACTENISAITF